MGFLVKLDHALFFLINGMGREWLDPVFVGLSELGGWTIGIVAMALLANHGRRVLGRQVLVLLLGAAVFMPLNAGLKRAVDRDRPVRVFQEQIRDGTVTVRTAGTTPRHNAFPSGHSMLAFFLMTYAALARPGCGQWVLPLAFLMALSRVYVGAHFPLDCVAGGLLGAAGGYLCWLLHRRWFGAQEAPA